MIENKIVLTPTVASAVEKLAAKNGKVHAADLVKTILEYHAEYGAGAARGITAADWERFSSQTTTTSVDWMDQVSAIFEPSLVPSIHGRLAILGLCELDETLKKHLRIFCLELKRELTEDFESLLLPQYAKEQRYRGEFLGILNNRGKFLEKKSLQRANVGFLVLVHGGPNLDVLNELCFRQSYNTCITARYQLQGAQGIENLFQQMPIDLESLSTNTTDTIGKFLPQPIRADRYWWY